MIQGIVFGFVVLGVIIWLLISVIKKKKYKKNAINAFSEQGGENDPNLVMLNVGNTSQIINYLKSLLNMQTEANEFIDKKVVINIDDGGSSIFLHIDAIERNIEILINPKSQNDKPIAVPYESFEVVKLIHKTYSVTTGSGKNRSTTYYNKYITSISVSSDVISEITVYNNRTQVSSDRGNLEIHSRRIGELFAKLLKIDLIRTDGKRVKYNDLDASILQTLDNINSSQIILKKNLFSTSKMEDCYVINKLVYYRVGALTLGIIFSSVVFIAGLIFGIKFATWLSIFPIIALFVVFLIMWIKMNKYKTPHEKPLVYVYRDQLIINPKFKNHIMVNGINIDLSNIEEIIVRYEKSKGFIVKALSDDKIYNIATYSREEQAQFLKNEILSLLKELK